MGTNHGGAILDADYPQSGVNIPRRSTFQGACAVPIARHEGYIARYLHGWFTEGFDSVDLKEAKALLDQLG